MQKHLSYVQDTAGNAIAGALVQVNLTSTGLPATLYSDNGTTGRTNPITSDTDGSYWFYAANGLYNIVVTKTGYAFDDLDSQGLQLYDGTSAGFGVLTSPDGANWTVSIDNDGALITTSDAVVPEED